MRLIRTLGLLAAMLLPAAAAAAPRVRPALRPSREVRTAVRATNTARVTAERLLRELPAAAELPGAYARLTRWVEVMARPRPDGKPTLVVVTVPGGVGLAWARRW